MEPIESAGAVTARVVSNRRALVLAALDAAYYLRAIPTGALSKDAMLIMLDRARGASCQVDSILKLLGIDAGTTSLDADRLKLRIVKGEFDANQ